jgi:hypothetical protein
MSIFALSYPLAPIVLSLFFLFGIIITSLFFGTLSIIVILILTNIGALRILPIIDIFANVLDKVFPDKIKHLKENLNESFQVNYSCTLAKNKKYIYLFHPHGLFSISQYFHIGTNLTNWLDKSVKGTALHTLWWVIPFGRELMEEFNFVKSNYSDMKQVLLDKKSLSVSPGGIKEIAMTHNNKITVNISSKRGIFKMALETGTELIPILVYGENELYTLYENKLFKIINNFLLKYNFYIPIPCAKSCINWLSLLNKPLEQPIITCVGEPIKVLKNKHPSDTDINALRELYITELKKHYKNTKPPSYEDEIVIL